MEAELTVPPTIRKTVQWLYDNDFVVIDFSEDPRLFSSPEPSYIVIMSEPDDLVHESKRLLQLLRTKHVRVEPLDTSEFSPVVSAIYDPVDETALIELLNVNDSVLFTMVN
jgi:hypothetical protein